MQQSLQERLINAYFGCADARYSLLSELDATPSARLHSLFHSLLYQNNGLEEQHLLFLLRTVVRCCYRASVVTALSNVLADKNIFVNDVSVLIALIHRNDANLMRHVLHQHFDSRCQDEPGVIHTLLSKSVNEHVSCLVVQKFRLHQGLVVHLRSAVKRGDTVECSHIIRLGATLDVSAYISAAARGYVDICELFIDAGFQDVRASNNKALRVACTRGHLKVCRHILHVALPRTVDYSNKRCSVLEDTVQDSERTRHIVSDIRACDNEAFRRAAGNGHVDVCKLLLSCGLTLRDIRCQNNNAFRWAAGKGHLDVCRLLLDCGLVLEDICACNNEAFRMACGNGHEEVVALLLKCGLTRDDVRADENYALRWGARSGNLVICKMLLFDCNLTLKDIQSCGNEAFRWAAGHGHLHICKLFMDWRGINPDGTLSAMTLADIRSGDNAAFRIAASHGHLDVCKYLIRCGLTVDDAYDRDGEALVMATQRGHSDMCAFLLSLNLLDKMHT